MGNCEYTPNSNSEKKCAWKQCEKETDRGRLSTPDKSTEQNHSNVKEKLAIRKSTQCWEQWFRKQKKKKGKVNSWGVDFEYLAVAPHFLPKLLLMAKFFKISSSCKHVTPFRCRSVIPWLGQFKQMITSTCVWLKVHFCSHQEKSVRQFSTLGDRLEKAKWTVVDSLKLPEKFSSSYWILISSGGAFPFRAKL